MLFLEDHIRAVLPALAARRDQCDAMICMLSAGEVVKLTRVGKFNMSAEATGAIAWLKRMRGRGGTGSNARGQMKMLRQLPRLLRFIPGTAQDVRAYFMALQYWLAGSEENLANMVRMLVGRYAAGTRAHLAGSLRVAPPVEYPEVGLYHPRAAGRIVERIDQLPSSRSQWPCRLAVAAVLRAIQQRGALRRRDRGAGGEGIAGDPRVRQRAGSARGGAANISCTTATRPWMRSFH